MLFENLSPIDIFIIFISFFMDLYKICESVECFFPQKIMRPNLRPRNNHRRLAHLSYRQIHVYKLGCLLLGTFHVNNNSDAPNDAT